MDRFEEICVLALKIFAGMVLALGLVLARVAIKIIINVFSHFI